MSGAAIALVALAIDAVVGWPRNLHAMIGHPVTWIGRLIDGLDGWLNLDGAPDSDRRTAGVMAALAVIVAALVAGGLVQWLLPGGWLGLMLTGVVAWPLVAARSLHDHVKAVATPLGRADLAGARQAVAQIVGRDPDRLDQPGIARAAIESLSENASDGVIAPLFWGALLGLPGMAAYKAINTLDSMIGHKTPRHLAFGWAAARIDDAANWIPARLTGLLFAALSPSPRVAFDTMLRDAPRHRSPNGGWPEAAMAAGLGVRLSGPRAYDGGMADEPWINGDARDPDAADITRALATYRQAMLAAGVILAMLALV